MDIEKNKDIIIFYKRTGLDSTEVYRSVGQDVYPIFEFLIHNNYSFYIKASRDLDILKVIELKPEDFKHFLGVDIFNENYNNYDSYDSYDNGYRLYDREIFTDRGLKFLNQIKMVERRFKLKDIL